MAGITIEVTPEKLRQTSGEFASTRSSIQTKTNRMISIVHELSGNKWTGQAQQAYVSKFSSIEGDVQKLLKMIQDHCDNLQKIAAEYEKAEQSGIQQASTLKTNVIS